MKDMPLVKSRKVKEGFHIQLFAVFILFQPFKPALRLIDDMRYLHWISKRWPRSTGVAQCQTFFWVEVAGTYHKDENRYGCSKVADVDGEIVHRFVVCWFLAGCLSRGCIRQAASCDGTQYSVIIIKGSLGGKLPSYGDLKMQRVQ